MYARGGLPDTILARMYLFVKKMSVIWQWWLRHRQSTRERSFKVQQREKKKCAVNNAVLDTCVNL